MKWFALLTIFTQKVMVKVLFKHGEDGFVGMQVKVNVIRTGENLEAVKAEFMSEFFLMFDAVKSLPSNKEKSYVVELPSLKILERPRNYTFDND